MVLQLGALDLTSSAGALMVKMLAAVAVSVLSCQIGERTPVQLTYTLTGTERPGWYLLGGIMVFAGQDPLNPLNWLVVSTVPLRVP